MTIGYFKVLKAVDKGPKPNPHGGQLYRWSIDIVPKDGGDTLPNVYWQKKSEEPISEGDEFHGEVSKGDYGLRFRLTSPDGPGPRSNTNQGGLTGSRGSSSTPGVAAKGADSGGPPPADWVPTSWTREAYGGFRYETPVRSARIERQHAQEMGLRACALDGDASRANLLSWINWFCADLDNASPNTPPPTDREGAASESGPERHSEPDPPSPSVPCTPHQKAKLTKALNAKIAKVHHDRLKSVFGADYVAGAKRLYAEVEALDSGDVDTFLTSYGITPASDVPDDPGEGPTEKELAQMGLTPTDEGD